jgi:hypothetical protein
MNNLQNGRVKSSMFIEYKDVWLKNGFDRITGFAGFCKG